MKINKIILYFVLGILILQNILASCEENQIDINSASAKELDKIVWVGPATAEKIISARPFESLKNLIKISGISESRLDDIKNQNLACVEDSEEDYKEKKVSENIRDIPVEEIPEKPKNKTLEIISLTPQNIKSENNSKSSGRNYAMYGFIGFCILLGFLFASKKIKDKFQKNEFES